MISMPSVLSRALAGATLVALAVDAPAFASHPDSSGTAVTSALQAKHQRTYYVSRHGHNAASGRRQHPLRTIQAAINRAPAGGTVVVRPGLYHESLTIIGKDGLTLRAARRGTVWVDGSSPVHRWRRQGRVWVRHHWNHQFNDSPTFTWNAPDNPNPDWSFINPKHPMAAHPDQVFVDGHSLRQVSKLSAVRRGRFYVDYDTHNLYIGTSPRHRSVRASTIEKAMTIRSSGVTVDGIDVRGFAPSVPDMGAITVESPHITLEHMLVRDMSTTGVFVGSTNDHLRSLVLRHNGLAGFMATYANGLRVSRVDVVNNNTELFNISPAAGGAKIGRTSDVVIRRSRFAHNHADGLWFDESSYRIKVIQSRMLDNAGHGLVLEISGHAVVAGNVIAGSGWNGIKINDTDHVQLWNNTFVGNARPIAILQDDRDVNPGGSYHNPNLPLPWIDRHITVDNNIVANPGAGSDCMLCVQDYTGRFTAADLDITANGNVYQRANAASPTHPVLWSQGAAPPALFTTLRSFHATTGQEASHLVLTGRPAVTRSYRARSSVRAKARHVAQPLPRDLARLGDRGVGSRTLGAWFGG
jgi:hypothetical protein